MIMGWFEWWLLGFCVTWVIVMSQAAKHEIGGPVMVIIAVLWPITVPFAALLWLMDEKVE